MSSKNETITNQNISESSTRLVNFLEETALHKKDFAEMIGVTLSYVYSLIDNTIAFSTRTTTLERIAIIMDINPSDIPEYKASEEPKLVDPGVQFLKQRQKELQLSNVQLLKRFPRQKRLEIVDLWRGAEPLPLDWNQLALIGEILDLSPKEIYPYWQARLQQYLVIGGIDLFANTGLINSMFEGAKGYLKV
jgi:DNA-binding Xre family transcriptional regulator